jgi:hypothetical protein
VLPSCLGWTTKEDDRVNSMKCFGLVTAGFRCLPFPSTPLTKAYEQCKGYYGEDMLSWGRSSLLESPTIAGMFVNKSAAVSLVMRPWHPDWAGLWGLCKD